MNKKILIFGDSITWGACDKEGGWATRLKRYTDQQTIAGKANPDEVYILGISGDNSDDLVKRFQVELSSRLDEEMELVIIIAIGTNDSKFSVTTMENRVSRLRYQENISRLIKEGKEATKEIVLIGLTPVDDELLGVEDLGLMETYDNINVQKYNKALKEVAAANKIPLIELYEYLKKHAPKELLSDGLHPNTEGHELIYRKVLTELKDLHLLD